jgi:hypothetical protein
MAALTKGKITKQNGITTPSYIGGSSGLPVGSGITLYRGAHCFETVNGSVYPAQAGAAFSGRLCLGVWEGDLANGTTTANQSVTGDASGNPRVLLRAGTFVMATSGTFANSQIGTQVYALDDQTAIVAQTNYPIAGRLVGINADGTVNVKTGVEG